MTSWMKQRDLLVEQTLAFVQGVAAKRPIRIAVAEAAVESVPDMLSKPALTETALAQVALARVALDQVALITETPLAETPLAEIPFNETAIAETGTADIELTGALDQTTACPAPVPSAAEAIADEAVSNIEPASMDNAGLLSLMVLSQSASPPALIAPSQKPIVSHAPQVAAMVKRRTANKPPIELKLPERDVIAQRVARFRAGQQKLIRDRDDNYAAVQAQIRASLDSDPRA